MMEAKMASTPGLTGQEEQPKGLLLKFIEEPLRVIGGLFALAVVLLLLLKFTLGIPKDSLRIELAKALLNAGVVGVAAALLSLVAKHYETREDRRTRAIDEAKTERRYREELLKDTLNRITSSYNRAKRARRHVRALGLNLSCKPALVSLSSYDACMAEVNDAQLELETIAKDVETNAKAFSSATALQAHLKMMEEYLGDINKNYEATRSTVPPTEKEIPLTEELSKFDDFVAKGPSPFVSYFVLPHNEARSLINRDLLALTSRQTTHL